MAQAQCAKAEHAGTVAQWDSAAAAAACRLTEQGFRREDIAAACGDVERSEGELKQAEARYLEREVRSPADAGGGGVGLRPRDSIPPHSPGAQLLEAAQL